MKSKILLLMIFLTIPILSLAQKQSIKIPLKIERGKTFTAFVWNEGLAFDKQELVARSHLGNVLKIKRSSANSERFIVSIERNPQSKFSPDILFEMGIDDSKTFTQPVLYGNGQTILREFELTSNRDLKDKK